jgi:hypothetical protein
MCLNEWYVSAHIDVLPVNKEATSLEIAIARFPNNAAYIAFFDSPPLTIKYLSL